LKSDYNLLAGNYSLALNWNKSIRINKRIEMLVTKKEGPQKEEKEWEDPMHPAEPSDERDKEQIERQYREAKRRKDNLTETDHIDKEKKN